MKRIHSIVEILFIFFCSLTPLLWLRNGEIILGHDSGFRLDPFQYLHTLWYSWNPNSGFGVDVNNYSGFLIAQFPEAFFSHVFGSLNAGQTMSFIFWFFTIGISMFILMRNFFTEKKYWSIRILASIFYMYNFYLLQGWFISERAKFSLFAALPLLFLIFWKMLSHKWGILQGSILIALTLFFLNGGGSPPLYGGILVALGILFAYFIVLSIIKRNFIEIIYVLRCVLSIGVATVCINAYWVLPQLYFAFNQYASQLSSSGGIAGILSWEEAVNRYASLINLLRLQGIPDWYENPMHPYSGIFLTSPILIIASFIPSAIMLYVLMKKTLREKLKDQRVFLFVCFMVFLIGLVMTAGSHRPFGFIYIFLLKYLPGFAIFRSAFYKFGPSYWFSAVILFSVSFYLFISQVIKNNLYQKIALSFVIIGVLLYHFPYFTGTFFLWNKPFSTKIVLPQYVKNMFQYLNSTYLTQDNHILILPPLDTAYYADSYSWGFWSLDLLARLSLRSSVIANDSKGPLVAALYDAALRNRNDIFEAIAGRLGIDKILWRNDILYSDKKSDSRNFSYIRDSILKSTAFYNEKTFGEWFLYSTNKLLNSNNIVSVEPLIYRADIYNSDISYFFNANGVLEYPFVFSSDLHKNITEQNLGTFIKGNVLQAECMFCGYEGAKNKDVIFIDQYARFLPSSPFYTFIRQKETKLLSSVQGIPEALVDADLGLATKRIVELSGVINQEGRDNIELLSRDIVMRFKERIDDAFLQIEKLGDVKKNIYKVKINLYIRYFIKYIAEIEKKNILPGNFISSFYEYLRNATEKLSLETWISDGNGHDRYFLTIPTKGLYHFLISNYNKSLNSIKIDNETILDYSQVDLSEGIHKIELTYEPINEIAENVGATEKIFLTYHNKKSYILPALSSLDNYELQFQYKISQGRSIYVALYQNNDSLDKSGNIKRAVYSELEDDGKWHSANFVIQPNFGVSTGEVVFFTANTSNDLNALEVENLTVRNISPSRIFVVRENEKVPVEMPSINVKRNNSAIYTVKVDEAKHPYILNFKQTFNQGWKAFVIPSGDTEKYENAWQRFKLLFQSPVEETQHFSIDGYTNAWIIKNTGSYTVLLVYWPHMLFLVSVVCSVISILLTCLVVLKIIREKGKSHE